MQMRHNIRANMSQLIEIAGTNSIAKCATPLEIRRKKPNDFQMNARKGNAIETYWIEASSFKCHGNGEKT